jgi:hypothetical protein
MPLIREKKHIGFIFARFGFGIVGMWEDGYGVTTQVTHTWRYLLLCSVLEQKAWFA